MRDLLILAVFFVGILYTFRNPFVGLILFMWISVMNPHRFGWGLTYDMPLAMVASAATLLSMALHLDQVRIPKVRELVFFLTLWVWITLTTYFAFYPEDAWQAWITVTKIFVMTFVVMLLTNTRQRLFYFVLSLVGFVGFIGLKGAVFGILTAGKDRVWGPPGSFLEDNNSLALAMVMVLPPCLYLRMIVKKRWLANVLLGIGVSLVVSIVLTYSRGGLLGLVAAGGLATFYSRHKFRVTAIVAIVVLVALSVMPAKWLDRMSTIKTYEQDDSANMRLNSWETSYNLAKDRVSGGGFDCFSADLYYRYSPNPELGILKSGAGSTAHSIYFEVIAMHGFVGLAIFMICHLSILLSMRIVERQARTLFHGNEAITLSRAIRASTVGFLVSGAFLSRAFFDLYWAIFAAAVCLKFMVQSGVWDEDPAAGLGEPSVTDEPEVAGPRTRAIGPGQPDSSPRVSYFVGHDRD